MLLFLWYAVSCASFIAMYDDNVSEEYRRGAAMAMDMIGRYIALHVNVIIRFRYAELESGTIGACVPVFCGDGFKEDIVLVPSALMLQRSNGTRYCVNARVTPSMAVTLSSSVQFFLDGSGRGAYHYATVLAHEICHGLGVATEIANDRGEYSPWFPSAYDVLLFNLNQTLILSQEQIASLTSNRLYLLFLPDYPLYARSTFMPGISIHHGFYGLMNYKSSLDVAACMMDVYTLRILKELGYAVKNCDDPDLSTVCKYCTHGIPCVVSGAASQHWDVLEYFFL